MIQGQDLLSQYPNATLLSVYEGYVYKCKSDPSGLCHDRLGDKSNTLRDGKLYGTISKRKAKVTNYFKYVMTTYYNETRGQEQFTRSEYYLPNGELIYTSDCFDSYGECFNKINRGVLKLLDRFYSQEEYRKPKSTKPKIIRKPKKVVKKKKGCGCK